MRARRGLVTVPLIVSLAACGGETLLSPPTIPTPTPQQPSVCLPGQQTASRMLVAGQSNAILLLPSLPEAIDCTFVGGSVDFWIGNANFAQYSRAADLEALVWWQGAADTRLTRDQYAEKLRALIAVARTGNPALRIRIIEIPDTPDRASVREAQLDVSRDAGVSLIPTADLPLDASGHFFAEGYRTVRDRLYRSLGR